MGDYDSGGMDPNWRPPGHSAAELEKDNESLRKALTDARAEVGRLMRLAEINASGWGKTQEARYEAEARATAAEDERDELAAQLAALHKLYGERCDLPDRARQIMDIVGKAVAWSQSRGGGGYVSEQELAESIRAYMGDKPND